MVSVGNTNVCQSTTKNGTRFDTNNFYFEAILVTGCTKYIMQGDVLFSEIHRLILFRNISLRRLLQLFMELIYHIKKSVSFLCEV